MKSSMHFPPIPSRASRAKIWAFAEAAAQKLGLQRGALLEPYVARIGGKIIYKNPETSEEKGRLPESIIVRSRRDFTIYLPVMTSISRDRFTIAHELGHFFIHFPLVERAHPGAVMAATRWVDESNSDLTRAEWEANWFAAAFLMPSSEFAAAYKANPDTKRLASRFAVSEAAVEIRISSLGL